MVLVIELNLPGVWIDHQDHGLNSKRLERARLLFEPPGRSHGTTLSRADRFCIRRLGVFGARSGALKRLNPPDLRTEPGSRARSSDRSFGRAVPTKPAKNRN